ncbi:MAG: hypothetical protein F4W89_11630 [Acidobacteria bacterium]|nr:hypothetical protein [Acidobacteriota bacterium]
MVDLARIVSVVEIDSVRLCEAHCRSVHPMEIGEESYVKSSYEASVVNEPGESEPLEIEVAFRLDVSNASDQREFQAEIRAKFELSYQIPADEEFSSEELEAFADINAVFNAWPYWREWVQTSMSRMGMPVMTVPVFRVQRPASAEAPATAETEDESDESTDESSRP